MSAAPSLARALDYDELFLARYDQLLKWALRLTHSDRELARDLVQEAFLQFSVSTGDRQSINNIDNYLHGVVRNTYLSYLRKSPSRQYQVIDFDSPETQQLTIDPRHQIRAKDDLVAICQRACARKETSVAASLLILRFFHGYLPGEIAKLTRRTRNVVDVQLKLARFEAIAFTLNAGLKTQRMKCIRTTRSNAFKVRSTNDLMSELREEILSTRNGDCLDRDGFIRIQNSNRPVPRSKLSHLVSCAECLDEANRILGLPLLKERNVLDLLGRAKGVVHDVSISALVRQMVCLMTSWSIWTLLSYSDSIF